MPADLDQFGRDNSHGTVVGGEGLVQLTHDAANGGGLFHQFYHVSGISQIQGGLHPGDTPADDHDGARDFVKFFVGH
jgi:hypothetical protein